MIPGLEKDPSARQGQANGIDGPALFTPVGGALPALTRGLAM